MSGAECFPLSSVPLDAAPGADWLTCGACGMRFPDLYPAGRCPFEGTHLEPRDVFRRADGTLTAYALACGYLDTFSADGAPYYSGEAGALAPAVMLERTTPTYAVRSRTVGTTHDAGGFPLWLEVGDGSSVRADWSTFETLGEARRAWRMQRARIRRGLPVLDCLELAAALEVRA